MPEVSLNEIFDEHFEVIVNKGMPLDNSFYLLEDSDAQLSLDINYVCKNSQDYRLGVGIYEIVILDVDLNCMEGSTEYWDANLILTSNFSNNILEGQFFFTVKE